MGKNLRAPEQILRTQTRHSSFIIHHYSNNSMSSSTNPSAQNNSIRANPSPTNSDSSGGHNSTNVSKDDIVALRMKDVVLDKDNMVTRIGDFDITKINLNNIRFFMGANNIKLKRETKRAKLVDLIAAARIEYERAADRLLPKNASTKPSFIETDKTFFRVIHCYFDPSIRVSMQKLGNSLTKDEVDSRRKKIDAYESLLLIYNDELKYCDTRREECDRIATAKGMEATFKYINYHYKVAYDNWNRSGSHDDFDKFVGNKLYLNEYWKLLHLTDDAMLSSVATAELPEEVFNSSLSKTKTEMNFIAKNNKKSRIDYDMRRTEAIESMAKSMTDYYKNAMNDSSKEEQIVYYENKLIEALERHDKLNNERAKAIVNQQIEKFQKKIDDLNS